MKKKLSVAVVSSSLLLNMVASAAFAEPAGMYYAGKYYSADYIQSKIDSGDKTFASVVKKAQAAKSDAYVVLDDRNSYVTAKDYDFENLEATGDASLLNVATPLKASYTNANSKESLKKVTPDSLKAATISADGLTITFDLADSKYIKMSSTTSAYTLVDENGAKGPVVSKVKADAKKKTLALTLKTALTAGKLYTVQYNKTDTGLDLKQPVKDTVAPVVKVTGLTDGAKVDSVTLNFTVTATDNVDTSVTPVVKLNGAAQTGDKGNYSVTLKEGENTITVDASDKAGNKAATQIFKVTYEKAVVDTEKPVIKSSLTDGATVSSADLSFTVTVTDNVDTSIAPVVKLGDKEVSAVDGKYSVTLAEGANTITVTATDKAGNKAEATYKVTYEKAQVVTVTAITDVTTKVGATVDPIAVTVSPSDATVSVSVDDSSIAAVAYADGKITVTPKAKGTATVTVKATKGTASDTKTFKVTVAEADAVAVAVTASNITASGFTLSFDKAVTGLASGDIAVKDDKGAAVTATVTVAADAKSATVAGTFTANSTYTVTVTKSGFSFGDPLSVKIPETLSVTAVTAVTGTELTVKGTGFTTDNVKANGSQFSIAPKSGSSTISVTAAKVVSSTEVALTISDDTPVQKPSTVGTANYTLSFVPTSGATATKLDLVGEEVRPVIESVKVLDATHFQIIYAEKIQSAPSASNITILNTATGKSQTLGQTSSTTTAVLGADKKTVSVSIGESNAALDGVLIRIGSAYQFNTGNYYVYTSSVQDLAGNIINGTNRMAFTVTEANLADVTAPSFADASYNTATSQLTLTFDEGIMGSSKFDATKLSITTSDKDTPVVFDNTDVLGSLSDGVTSVTITLSTSHATSVKTWVDAGKTLVVAAKASAWQDVNANLSKESTQVIKVQTPPLLVSAAYDEPTNILTLTWDQNVAVPSSGLAYGSTTILYFEGASSQAVSSTNSALIQSDNPKVIKLLLNGFTEVNNDSTPSHKITLPDGFVKNQAGTQNSAAVTLSSTNNTLTYNEEVGTPILSSAAYNNSTKKLTLAFDKYVLADFNQIAWAKIAIYKVSSSGTETDITPSGYSLSTNKINNGVANDSKTIVLDLSSVSTTSLDDAVNDGSSIVVRLAEGAFKSTNGTFNATTTTTQTSTAQPVVTVAGTDAQKPTVSGSPSAISRRTVSVTFTEKVDPTSATNISNYSISVGGAGTNLAISSASIDSTGKTVILVTDYQSSAATYLLNIQNVKDTNGNVIDAVTKTFTGSSSTNSPTLVASSVTKWDGTTQSNALTINDADNSGDLSDNDSITLTFNTPVKLVTASSDATTLTEVSSIADLTTSGAHLSHLFTFGDKVNSASDADILKGATLEKHPTENNKLVLKLKKNSSDSKQGWRGTRLFTYDGSTSGTNLNTLAPTLSGSKSYIVSALDNSLTGGSTAQMLTAPDLTPPQMSSVVFADTNSNNQVDAGDTLTATFNKNLDTSSPTSITNSDFTMTDTNGSTTGFVMSFGGSLGGNNLTQVTGNQVVLTLKGSANDFVAGSTLSQGVVYNAYLDLVNSTTNVKDKWGNTGKPLINGSSVKAGKAVTLANVDTTAPYISDAKYVDNGTAGLGQGDELIVTFSKPVNVSASLNVTDFTTPNKAATLSGVGIQSVTQTAGNKVVFTYSAGATASNVFIPGDTIEVAGTGSAKVADLTGNILKLRASVGQTGTITVADASSTLTDSTAPTITSAVLNAVSRTSTKGLAFADSSGASGLTLLTNLGIDPTAGAAGGDFVAFGLASGNTISITGNVDGSTKSASLAVTGSTTVTNLLTTIEQTLGLSSGSASVDTNGLLTVSGLTDNKYISSFSMSAASGNGADIPNFTGNLSGVFAADDAKVRLTFSEPVVFDNTASTSFAVSGAGGTSGVLASTSGSVTRVGVTGNVVDVLYTTVPTPSTGYIKATGTLNTVEDLAGNDAPTATVAISSK